MSVQPNKKGNKWKQTRHDKFYQLAKEQGFRSRAAFKLIQLNRKYEFLNNCKSCLDLCAAPGGWLQVASKYMPVSSLIVGVDLLPIKPIPRVTTIQGDITSAKTKAEIKKELQGWDVDVVLHDGAPNVGGGGGNWAKDAFTQIELVMFSLKICTEFLKPGGWFVTKIFRSQDYNSLLWVLKQFFKKVEVTKPAASRDASAEIFAVCQHYLAPKKIDPRLLDPSAVFQHFEDLKNAASSSSQNVLRGKQAKRNRSGYDDDVGQVVFKKTSIKKFIESSSETQAIDILGSFNSLSFDDQDDEETVQKEKDDSAPLPCFSSSYYAAFPETNEEIRSLCADLKVLGKADFKNLLKWRKKMNNKRKQAARAAAAASSDSTSLSTSSKPQLTQEEEEEKLEKQLEALAEKREKEARNEARRKQEQKMKAKKRQLLNENNMQGKDIQEAEQENDEEGVFSLASLKKKTDLETLESLAEAKEEEQEELEEILAELEEEEGGLRYPSYIQEMEKEGASEQAIRRAINDWQKERMRQKLKKKMKGLNDDDDEENEEEDLQSEEEDEEDDYYEMLESNLESAYQQYKERRKAITMEEKEKQKKKEEEGEGILMQDDEAPEEETMMKGKQDKKGKKRKAEKEPEVDEEGEVNPLLAKLRKDRKPSSQERVSRWFDRDLFQGESKEEDVENEEESEDEAEEDMDEAEDQEEDEEVDEEEEDDDDIGDENLMLDESELQALEAKEEEMSSSSSSAKSKKGKKGKKEDEKDYEAKENNKRRKLIGFASLSKSEKQLQEETKKNKNKNEEDLLLPASATTKRGQRKLKKQQKEEERKAKEEERELKAQLSGKKPSKKKKLSAEDQGGDFEEVEAPVSDEDDDIMRAPKEYVGDSDEEDGLEDEDEDDYSSMDESDEAVAERLAIATKMIQKKKREEMIESAYNRYSFNDLLPSERESDPAHALPVWFIEDEMKHNQASKPITKEEVDFFKQQLKAINARPIKKIAEAKARKKMRTAKRWEKIKAKADEIASSNEISSQSEKIRQIEKLYFKSKSSKPKRERVYVVSKKGGGAAPTSNKRGKTVAVDRKMKKDKRGLKSSTKKKTQSKKLHNKKKHKQ